MREYHVRFRERFGVKLPLPTLHSLHNTLITNAQARAWQHATMTAYAATKLLLFLPIRDQLAKMFFSF